MTPSSRTITALTCPECHALAGDPPTDCDYCEEGGKLLPVDYCLASERDAAVARAEAAEAQYREFIDGLTAKLNAAGVPATPTWPDVFRYLVARAERYGDALHDIAQGETVPMWAKLRAREALGEDA